MHIHVICSSAYTHLKVSVLQHLNTKGGLPSFTLCYSRSKTETSGWDLQEGKSQFTARSSLVLLRSLDKRRGSLWGSEFPVTSGIQASAARPPV